MQSVETELESFSQFVTTHIYAGVSRFTLDELFDLWRQSHPLHSSKAEDDVAIAASIEDFLAGDRGIPAGSHSAELRRQLGA